MRAFAVQPLVAPEGSDGSAQDLNSNTADLCTDLDELARAAEVDRVNAMLPTQLLRQLPDAARLWARFGRWVRFKAEWPDFG